MVVGASCHRTIIMCHRLRGQSSLHSLYDTPKAKRAFSLAPLPLYVHALRYFEITRVKTEDISPRIMKIEMMTDGHETG